MTVAKRTLLTLYIGTTVFLILVGLHVALHVVPPDASQGNVGRILYWHLPNWIAMI
jgi:ABC-type transport system involved in cytochrome c biogenesis permease subunit